EGGPQVQPSRAPKAQSQGLGKGGPLILGVEHGDRRRRDRKRTPTSAHLPAEILEPGSARNLAAHGASSERESHFRLPAGGSSESLIHQGLCSSPAQSSRLAREGEPRLHPVPKRAEPPT